MTRYVEDSVNPAGLQAGMYGYAGYWNGPFANLTAIRHDFPGKPVIGIATRLAGAKGADAIDLEPGTCGQTQSENFSAALAWLREGYSGQFSRPLLYTMASWQAPLERYLAANGVPRNRVYLWSSHVGLGQHYCSPAGCGYGLSQADATQYMFAQQYDRSCFEDYLFGAPPVATPPGTVVVQLGDKGGDVKLAQQRLIAWGYLPAGSDDGDFGSHTEAAVIAFQKAHALSPDGIAGPLTWAALKAVPPAGKPPVTPVPAPPYQYAPPFGLKVAIGRTSFRATWLPPVHAGQPAPEFQLLVYKAQAKMANLVASYPRVTGATEYEGGSLERGTAYVLHVVSGAGVHVKPMAYAEAAFRTA